MHMYLGICICVFICIQNDKASLQCYSAMMGPCLARRPAFMCVHACVYVCVYLYAYTQGFPAVLFSDVGSVPSEKT